MKEYVLEDQRKCIFSKEKFKNAFYKKMQQNNLKFGKQSQQKMIDDMAEIINTSSNTIKHWLMGHHGPSDLDKVCDVAKYLDVSVEELLKFENEGDNNMYINEYVNTQLKESNTIRFGRESVEDIYSSIVGFIETFRMELYSDSYDYKKTMCLFILLYTNLKLSQLFISRKMYKELSSFVENYLQLMLLFPDIPFDDNEAIEDLIFTTAPDIDFPYVSVDFTSNDYKLFIEELEYTYDYPYDPFDLTPFETFIIDTAYKRLKEIFIDYIN